MGVGSEDFGIGELGSREGSKSVGEMSVGLRSSFNLAHSIGNEGHGVLGLNGRGLSASKSSKGNEFHFVLIYYNKLINSFVNWFY